jgi:hypothetical protein
LSSLPPSPPPTLLPTDVSFLEPDFEDEDVLPDDDVSVFREVRREANAIVRFFVNAEDDEIVVVVAGLLPEKTNRTRTSTM